MPNPENIIPPTKGEVRNPKGRPKGSVNRSTIAKLVLQMKVQKLPENRLMKQLNEMYPNMPKKITIEELSTMIQAVKAITRGDTQAYKAILDSAYGAPKQEMEHSGSVNTMNKIEIEVYSELQPTATSEDEMIERNKHKLQLNEPISE